MTQFRSARVPRSRAWGFVLLSFVTFALLTSGCGETGGVRLKVDPELARESLTTFLETWSRGDKRESLEQASPKIIGRDPLWEEGAKLTEFKLGSETSDGANLHVQVELMVTTGEGATGSPTSHKLTYVVSTSPAITIFRNE
ncbi:MAG: hypothetical protein U1A77_18405 [Pirellulales bacterium]